MNVQVHIKLTPLSVRSVVSDIIMVSLLIDNELFFRIQHMLRLRKVVQMEKIATPSCEGKPRMLASSTHIWQRRIYQTNPLQNVIQCQQLTKLDRIRYFV